MAILKYATKYLAKASGVSVALLLACPAVGAPAQEVPKQEVSLEYANDQDIGIDEKLGETIPLDLVFTNEAGEEVTLDQLIDKPTILTLIYLRCPSICSPLINEVAATVDAVDLVPGEDYELLTVSFDITDDEKLVSNAKKSLLERMKREIPEDSWHFLTGTEDSISRLTDSVGFRFRREKSDFVHAGTVIFLSPQGKIVRYLSGLSILPADMKMALLDASIGKERTLMQRVQRLCYSYDSGSQSYALKVNRIILLVTLPGIGLFLAFLLVKRKKPAVQG